jgi:DNA-binding beta-propeller fold protein YncE
MAYPRSFLITFSFNYSPLPFSYNELVYFFSQHLDTTTINTDIFCAKWSVNATTIAGNPTGASGSDGASLNTARGIYLDSNDTLYAIDLGNRRVMKWPTLATEGIPINQTIYANYIHADVDKSLYISDFISGSVMQYNQITDSWKTVAGGNRTGNGTNQLSDPYGIWVDKRSGDIYVAEFRAHRVSLWKQNETSGTLLAGVVGVEGKDAVHFNGPHGIFVDEKEDALYVADALNDRIQRFQPIGNTTGETVAGIGSSGDALNQLRFPEAVFVVNSVDIYIADTYNHRIMQWKIGNYTAGGCCVAGCSGRNGTAPNELNQPFDLKFDSNGNLIVSDRLNNRVQKFDCN